MDVRGDRRVGRRAVLAAGAAGIAAAAARSVAAPTSVAAADHDPLRIGEVNTGAAETVLIVGASNGLGVRSDGGDGIRGSTSAWEKSGVYGYSDSLEGFGVTGRNIPTGSYGYLGDHDSSVYGYREHPGFWGAAVEGRAVGDKSAGVIGRNGVGTGGSLGTPRAGIEATAQPDRMALVVDGRAGFSQSGVALIGAGKRSARVWVDPLTVGSFALAAIQGYVSNLFVVGVTVLPSAKAIRIYLNRNAPSAVRVAWLVLEGP
jgi:hypothetical protein